MLPTTAFRFTGKVALLTGGAAGIGLAAAKALMDEGAKVFIVDYSHPNIKSASQALKLAGYSQSAYVLQYADAADDASVIAFVDKCVEEFGGLDVAVLNAGIGGKQKPLWECSADEYDLVMRINARGRACPSPNPASYARTWCDKQANSIYPLDSISGGETFRRKDEEPRQIR